MDVPKKYLPESTKAPKFVIFGRFPQTNHGEEGH
jgi:hypothetical protein